jgi:thiamine monophosphate kinase
MHAQIHQVHAMSDCFAMGARPRAALALAVVPLGAERLMEEELFQMMVSLL